MKNMGIAGADTCRTINEMHARAELHAINQRSRAIEYFPEKTRWDNPNAPLPLVIPTPLDKAVEAQRMAEEVRTEKDHGRKVILALKLVDFILEQ